MLNLRAVVNQLADEEYDALIDRLQNAKAEKFHTLLTLYRESDLDDGGIISQLGIKQNAFYVLKSRLFEKIQECLIENMTNPHMDPVQKSILLPTIIFDTPREKALAILTKMEKEFQEYDLPYELTNVYGVLKKLHQHTDKHYTYTALYNKHVAYTLSLDKAEDLLADFMQKAGRYLSSRDRSLLAVLPLIKKEIQHISTMYDSHHLKTYRNIVNVTSAIFLPLEEATKEDDPVEDILSETEEIIQRYPKDFQYHYIKNIISYLRFEYYYRLGLDKKAAQYFHSVDDALPLFLNYSNYCLSSVFLLTKLEWSIDTGEIHNLASHNEDQFANFSPDKDDIPNYTNYVKYLAGSEFFAANHGKAEHLLGDLLNEISFKQHPHYELEVKFFMIICYIAQTKFDLAWNLLRSVIRKVRMLNEDMSYENAVLLIKILKTIINSGKLDRKDKLLQMGRQYHLLNEGENKLLGFLRFDSVFMDDFSQYHSMSEY